ncbi:hypothetical protein [Sansalvadorimonas verongulae]|uniref:hypothetical protein n=1 Tax=Sansalvadorimonas verongulae TaxID=2172824 RepID=UPI0012BBADA0|nr:hypothetical protein [Sansalvadorimonas verongulae]MTI13876.1 hypothetical protein [Sansalvadorimonas verongulae]
MEGTQQYHPGTRIPLNTLYVDPDTQTFGQKTVSVMNDVKDVMVHAIIGIGCTVAMGKNICDRVPTPISLAGAALGCAAVGFLAPIPYAAAFGTSSAIMIGAYLVKTVAGGLPADKMALSQELPERRLLRRAVNLGFLGYNLFNAYNMVSGAASSLLGWLR